MRLALRPNRISLAAAVWCSLTLGVAAQEADEMPPSPYPAEVDAKITARLGAIDLTPQPAPEIPDNPPPHEGAMIDLPEYRVEPPDLLLIEVLETLPGQPISGERLVRPDGTVSLGFYGDVHVRGLTLGQAKIKIIKHLRRFLADEVLGLLEPTFESEPSAAAAESSRTLEVSPDGSIRVIGDAEPPQAVANVETPREVVLQTGEGVSIRIEVMKSGEPKEKEVPKAEEAEDEYDNPAAWRLLSPERSNRVFVDVTRYNSRNYHVMGDVAAPGRLPITGNETVLDALEHAGGLLNTADPNNIRLVRPGRDGKPGKVYPVDLEAIRDRGETATNYQMFPGDRLVVGRDKLVEKTVQIDRLATALHNVVASIQRQAEMNQALSKAYSSSDVAALKDAVEFWIREMNRPGGPVLDEDVLRDALLRRLQPKPEEPNDGE